MFATIIDWVHYDIAPAFGVMTELTIHALDSLPLPLLVVIFLALLASLRSGSSTHYHPSTPLLPSYSPSFTEKTRLSPSPSSPPSLPFNRIPPTSPVFYPSFDASGKPTYVAVIENSGTSASGTITPPRSGNYGRQRGSKRYSSGDWRTGSISRLPEIGEERAEV